MQLRFAFDGHFEPELCLSSTCWQHQCHSSMVPSFTVDDLVCRAALLLPLHQSHCSLFIGEGVFRRRHAPSQGAMHMADRKNTVTMSLCRSCPRKQRGHDLCSSRLGCQSP